MAARARTQLLLSSTYSISSESPATCQCATWGEGIISEQHGHLIYMTTQRSMRPGWKEEWAKTTHSNRRTPWSESTSAWTSILIPFRTSPTCEQVRYPDAHYFAVLESNVHEYRKFSTRHFSKPQANMEADSRRACSGSMEAFSQRFIYVKWNIGDRRKVHFEAISDSHFQWHPVIIPSSFLAHRTPDLAMRKFQSTSESPQWKALT